ncbi:MAG: hypothetical protein O3C57_02715 [Verrucomicrobia bacterium]|nr:hypothetical protein [Verrucomicrobiota bacterium]
MLADRLSKLRFRERAGLLFAVVAIALLMMDNLVVQPVARAYGAIGVEIKNQENQRAYVRSVISMEGEIGRRFESVRSFLGDFKPEPVMVDLMKGRIDELAKESGVLLFSMKHRPVKDMPHYREYYVDIGEFESDEASLLRFLHKLGSEESTFRVSKIEMKPDQEGELVRGSMSITKVAMPAKFAGPSG